MRGRKSRSDVTAEVTDEHSVVDAMYATTMDAAVASPAVTRLERPASTRDAHGFDEEELRLALEASVKETSGDLLAVELEYEGRSVNGAGTRTRGRALASKFWIQQALDADDALDASADGFYDVRGEAFEDLVDGKLPELAQLLNDPVIADEEALVVDRRTDVFLAALDDLARETCEAAPNTRAKCALLARLVSDRLGGSVKTVDDAELARSVAMDREDLLANGRGCVFHIGHLTKGNERHRAILFKALASVVDIPCRLVRGEYYCDGRDTARVIWAGEGEGEMWVDLCVVPGALRSCSESAGVEDIPPTPPRYIEETDKHWEYSHASYRMDKGKSPLISGKSTSQPPNDHSESSIDDLVAFANGSRTQNSTTSTSPKEADVDDLTDLYDAIAVAHGVSLKSVASAFKLTEDDMERANLLCNSLGAVLEEEACLSEEQRGVEYTEPVLLQEMFNLLVTSKWIVADAVRAFNTRRRAQLADAAAKLAEIAELKEAKRIETERIEAEERSRRRREEKERAADDLIRAAEERIEQFREERVKLCEDSERAAQLRHDFRAEWTAKVASMNLAETLECFGVVVEGGSHANAKQLRTAYRRALLQFHPDRQRSKDLVARVEAEERFKILSDKMESQ